MLLTCISYAHNLLPSLIDSLPPVKMKSNLSLTDTMRVAEMMYT